MDKPKYELGQVLDWNGLGAIGGNPQRVTIIGINKVAGQWVYSFDFRMELPFNIHTIIPIPGRAVFVKETNLTIP